MRATCGEQPLRIIRGHRAILLAVAVPCLVKAFHQHRVRISRHVGQEIKSTIEDQACVGMLSS